MQATSLRYRSTPRAATKCCDPQVISAAASGDSQAFAQIYSHFEAPITATVERLVGSLHPGDVPDVVQEIFHRLARQLHRWTPERGASLNTWTYTIVRNHCFDVLKRRRLPTISLSNEGSLVASTLGSEAAEAVEVLEFQELENHIDQAIRRLPKEQQIVVNLRREDELDTLQIATRLKLSLGTVKSRLARARAALRHELRHILAPA